jgi:hypothetical protein
VKKITKVRFQFGHYGVRVEAKESGASMARSGDVRRYGTNFGAAEAAKAIAAQGPNLTWDAAHLWLNQAVSAGPSALSHLKRIS